LRDPAAIRGWLYRIAHNIAMNHLTRGLRAEALDEEAPIESGTAGPEELAGSAEAAELVWDAAASLEPRQFAVLDLSVRKGLTTAEIAEVLGLDVPATSLAVHRAREALGNAVRYLLVARRRRHCDRLAELVPEGVRRLTAQQRATVDRHMRRCAVCQRTSAILTSPEQLFAAVPLVALPTRISQSPLAASHATRGLQHAGSGMRATRAARTPQVQHSTLGLGGIAAVAIAAVIAGILLLRPGGAPNTAPSAAAIVSHVASAPASSGPTVSTPAVSEGTLPGQIVFRAGPGQAGPQQFSEMNPDGTDVHQLSISGLLCCSASGLSPDGTKLLTVGEGAIGVIAGGTDGRLLGSSPICSFFEPTWSPSGDEIAYAYAERLREIDVVDEGGTTERQVVQNPEVGTAGGLAWSPDGTELAFVGSSGAIDVVAASGGRAETAIGPWGPTGLTSRPTRPTTTPSRS
jgi:Sigma-70, region 4